MEKYRPHRPDRPKAFADGVLGRTVSWTVDDTTPFSSLGESLNVRCLDSQRGIGLACTRVCLRILGYLRASSRPRSSGWYRSQLPPPRPQQPAQVATLRSSSRFQRVPRASGRESLKRRGYRLYSRPWCFGQERARKVENVCSPILALFRSG